MSAETRAMVGVGAVIGIAHRAKEGGPIHGHTYEVVAWFEEGRDAVKLQALLQGVLAELDHTLVDGDLARAEDIGRWVAARLQGCKAVDVNRPSERIYACVRP